MAVNPAALAFVALCVAIGFLLGHWVIGLIVGLVIVLLAQFRSFTP